MKISFSAPFCDPIDPKGIDFSQISLTKPPMHPKGLKRVPIEFLPPAGQKFGSGNVFFAFIGAKMARIDI